MDYMDWLEEQEKEEKEFWDSMGISEGYIDTECPNCGRHRVIHWSSGKSICEKCHWCLEIKSYFVNEHFSY